MKKIYLTTLLLVICVAVFFLLLWRDKGKTVNDFATAAADFSNDIFFDADLQYFMDTQVNNNHPITLTAWINEDWEDSYTFLFDRYQEYRPNVTIEVIKYPWRTYWAKLELALQSNRGPDIFHMHNEYSSQLLEYLESLPQSMFSPDRLGEFFRHAESAKIGDEMYFLNIGNTTGGIFYNKDMWLGAGLTSADIPTTWEDLREVAKQLTQYDDKGNITVDGFNFSGNTPFLLIAMQMQHGILPFSSDGRFSYFNNPENLINVRFLQELTMADHVSSFGAEPANEKLGNKRAAMIYAWPSVANDLDRYYQDIDYGFFRPPVWDLSAVPAFDRNNYECSFAINKQIIEDKKEVAFDLLLFYLCNDQALIKVSNQAKMIPSKLSLMNDDLILGNTVIAAQAEYIDKTAFLGVLPEAVFEYLKTDFERNIMNDWGSIEYVLSNADTTMGEIMTAAGFDYRMPDYPYYHEFKAP